MADGEVPTPVAVPPPAASWPRATLPGALADELGEIVQLLGDEDRCGLHLALVVVRAGELVAEHYGPTAGPDATLISWSMAKSVVHALVGICVREGLLTVDQPAPVGVWSGDERRRITIAHLLAMSSGLRFREDYLDADRSDAIEMLFGGGQLDMAGYAASQPLDASPGSLFNYSSGTSNILARIVGDAVGGSAEAMRGFMHRELFGPLGMSSADPRFDASGTFVGSSFLYCTATDFARFGELYRLGGRWGDRQILPAGWTALAARPAPVEVPASEAFGYGAHWWTWDRVGLPGVFAAHGYEVQRIVVDPARALVVVRLGKTPAALEPNVRGLLQRLVTAFPVTS